MSIVRPGIATMDASCSIKDSHNSINFIFSEQSSFHRRWAMIPFKPVLAPVVVVLQVLFNREVEAIVRSSVCREASWIYFRKLGSNLSLWPSIEQWSPAQNHHKVLGVPPLKTCYFLPSRWLRCTPVNHVCPESWSQSIEVDCNERETPTLVNGPGNRKALQFESIIFFSSAASVVGNISSRGTKFGSNSGDTNFICHAA